MIQHGIIYSKKNFTHKDNLIFTSKNNKRIINISKTFDRIVNELGFNNGISDRRQKIVFHSLRHTYASWLIQNGKTLFEVAQLLGHSDIKMTMRYSHLAPENTIDAATTISELFNNNYNNQNNIAIVKF